jgi:acetyl esterase/lipase
MRLALALVLTGLMLGEAAFAQSEKDVAYGKLPQQVLDVWKVDDKVKKPVVIFFHGGGWAQGNRQGSVPGWVQPFVDKGFVVFNVRYRLLADGKAPAAAEDAVSAVKWVKENAKRYNGDSKKVVVSGVSAGAHLALMAAMADKSAGIGTESVAAVINFCGPTDLELMLALPTNAEVVAKWIGDNDELARRMSPINYVRKGMPSILSIHGDADESVPYEQSVNLTRDLRKSGNDAELIPLAGVGHDIKAADRVAMWPRIWEFLQRRGLLP